MGAGSEAKSLYEFGEKIWPKIIQLWNGRTRNKVIIIVIFITILAVAAGAIVFHFENKITISQVNIDYKNLDLQMGDTAILHATALLSNGKTYNNIIWYSSNPSVAEVDSDGAVAAVSKGTAEITAQATRFGKSSFVVCTVTVKCAPTGYSILLSANEAATTEIVKVHVYTLPEEEVNKITIYAVSPSGQAYKRALNDDGYYFYNETGRWTIYAEIENSSGSYIGKEEDEIAYLDVSGQTYRSLDELPGILFGTYGDILEGMLGK